MEFFPQKRGGKRSTNVNVTAELAHMIENDFFRQSLSKCTIPYRQLSVQKLFHSLKGSVTPFTFVLLCYSGEGNVFYTGSATPGLLLLGEPVSDPTLPQFSGTVAGH